VTKKPDSAQISQWRYLQTLGKSYAQIGKETGAWQGRTVKKYVGQDLESREGRGVRLELFKERLGPHWDMLLGSVLGDLESIRVPGPAEALPSLGSQDAPRMSLAGALVYWKPSGEITVKVNRKSHLQWSLLAEPLPSDSIWEATKAWEAALAADLNARRKLCGAVSHFLAEFTGLPVVERLNDSPALMLRGVHMLVEEVLATAILSRRFCPKWPVWYN